MSKGESDIALPPTVRDRAEYMSEVLLAGVVQRVALSPLVVRQSVEALLDRRRRVFTGLDATQAGYGYAAQFTLCTKPSQQFPEGKVVAGSFDLLHVTDQLWVLASTTSSEIEQYGPVLLAKRAYPLGARPFVDSGQLLRDVTGIARERDWSPICVDAMGYDRETRGFRRDTKHQEVGEAFREMAEQGRQMHQMQVSFREGRGREVLRASFSRYGRAIVREGSVLLALDEFVLRVVGQSLNRRAALSIQREREPMQQKLVRLAFSPGTLARTEDIRALCDAIRHDGGMSVTTLHLNPYLNAQVLDYLTGEAVQLIVTDTGSAALIPRSESCKGTMERIVTTVFRHFGEAEVSVEAIA